MKNSKMPTINQLIRNGRKSKQRTQRTRALKECPQKQGVCLRVSQEHRKAKFCLAESSKSSINQQK